MEYVTHGWDLATATRQAVPFNDEEAWETLSRAEVNLPAQYRGQGMPFGEIVALPPEAPPMDRVVGSWVGRPENLR